VIAFDHPEPMDFLAECDALHALLGDRPEADLLLTTQFKPWTIEDVITHLHAGNLAAKWSLSDPDRLRATLARMPEQRADGHSLREIQRLQTGGLGGRKLLERWHEESARVAGPPEDPPAPGTRHPVHTGSTHPERQETP
jgi:hypothetical protein